MNTAQLAGVQQAATLMERVQHLERELAQTTDRIVALERRMLRVLGQEPPQPEQPSGMVGYAGNR